MTAYINGQEQAIYRNGVPQDVYVNGTPVHKTKREWIGCGNTSSTLVKFYESIADIRSGVPSSTLTLPQEIYLQKVIKFKGKYFGYSNNASTRTTIARFTKDLSFFNYSIPQYIISTYPAWTVIQALFTNLNGQVLYLAARGADNATWIYRSDDGENWTAVLQMPSRLLGFVTVPLLSGTVLFSDQNTTKWVFDHQSESLKTGIVPSALPGNNFFYLAGDKGEFVVSNRFGSSWDILNDKIITTGNAADYAVRCLRLYKDLNEGLCAVGWATNNAGSISNSVSRFKLDEATSSWQMFEYNPGVLVGMDQSAEPTSNNFMFSPEGTVTCRAGTMSTSRSFLTVLNNGTINYENMNRIDTNMYLSYVHDG